jgi:hypothetical protein
MSGRTIQDTKSVFVCMRFRRETKEQSEGKVMLDDVAVLPEFLFDHEYILY